MQWVIKGDITAGHYERLHAIIGFSDAGVEVAVDMRQAEWANCRKNPLDRLAERTFDRNKIVDADLATIPHQFSIRSFAKIPGFVRVAACIDLGHAGEAVEGIYFRPGEKSIGD